MAKISQSLPSLCNGISSKNAVANSAENTTSFFKIETVKSNEDNNHIL